MWGLLKATGGSFYEKLRQLLLFCFTHTFFERLQYRTYQDKNNTEILYNYERRRLDLCLNVYCIIV